MFDISKCSTQITRFYKQQYSKYGFATYYCKFDFIILLKINDRKTQEDITGKSHNVWLYTQYANTHTHTRPHITQQTLGVHNEKTDLTLEPPLT